MSENFDLGAAIEAEQNGNNSEATSTDTSESEIPFEMNEGTEGYYLFGNSSSISNSASVKAFNNDPFYEVFDYEDVGEGSWYDVDLRHYQELVEAASNPSKQEKLALIHALAKSNFGEIQGQKNEGYNMGWDTNGEGPPTIYDNDKVDHVPYFDVYPNFEAFEMDTLTESEIEMLEAEGLDMDNFGPMDRHEGPALPVINGERVPIIAESDQDVIDALVLLDSIDFDEVTYCPKHGELQGTPTLGPEGSDTENEEAVNQNDSSEGATSKEYPSFSLAEAPERVNSLNVNTLKGSSEAPERLHATALGTKRQVKTALRNEQEAENTRKGAVEALESRLDAIQGEASQEDVEEAVDEINGDVMPEDATDAEKNLASALLNSGAAEDLEEAKRKAGITA